MSLLHAQSLESMDSHPAPSDWEKIGNMAASRPKGDDDNVSLQELDGASGVCLWMVKRGHTWHPASGFYKVDEF